MVSDMVITKKTIFSVQAKTKKHIFFGIPQYKFRHFSLYCFFAYLHACVCLSLSINYLITIRSERYEEYVYKVTVFMNNLGGEKKVVQMQTSPQFHTTGMMINYLSVIWLS